MMEQQGRGQNEEVERLTHCPPSFATPLPIVCVSLDWVAGMSSQGASYNKQASSLSTNTTKTRITTITTTTRKKRLIQFSNATIKSSLWKTTTTTTTTTMVDRFFLFQIFISLLLFVSPPNHHCHSFTCITTTVFKTNVLHPTIVSTRLSSSSSGDNNKEAAVNGSFSSQSTTTALSSSSLLLDNSSSSLPRRRAGQDGYSVMRQPLQRETWDASIDPIFEIPKSVDSKQKQQQDSEWWTKTRNGPGSLRSKNDDDDDDDDIHSTTATSSPTPSIDVAAENLNLFQRSFDTLDFPYVLRALQKECFTLPGKKLVEQAEKITTTTSSSQNRKVESTYRPLLANTLEAVQEQYQAVQEMQWLLLDSTSTASVRVSDAYYRTRRGYQVDIANKPPPLEGHRFDLDSILQLVEEGQILEGPELLDISVMMNVMEELQWWSKGLEHATVTLGSVATRPSATEKYVNDNNNHHDDNNKNDSDDSKEPSFVQLPKIIQGIQLNTTLQTLLEEAFDDKGQLSGKTFPILGQLRATIRTLKADILQTLDAIVQLPSVKARLALESGGPLYSEVMSAGGGGRLVLPMDPQYASEFGIVHDSSRSGKTVYVEPSEIVGPTNQLRQVEHELEKEEAKVWRSLTEQVWDNRRDLQASVQAVAQLDLCVARCLLGMKWQGIIPTVQEEGVIALKDAKHPVLLLRQRRQGLNVVVGSDIFLGANGNQGLVLTGPNSGGKTVILKLLGLLALMSRSGIPIPAAPSSISDRDVYHPRVDFFNPVLADIGDIQSVDGDLSTFSGHMLVCREVLALAKSGKNALVLMDELGSGTDPAQGVAIAQALLEALLETGCRVAITTHYMALKQLASSDDRFSVAGMQFVGGRPTYKLLPGVVGESYALAVAERLQLPQTVLDRANELLDSETRQLGDLIRDMEDQKALIDQQVVEIQEKKKEIAKLETKMKQEQIRLEKLMLTARREEAQKFAKKLEEKEQILEDVLAKLKSDPSRKLVAKSWDEIKFVKRDAINEAENVPSVLQAKKKKAAAVEEAIQELVPLAEIRNRPILQEGHVVTVCKPGSLFGREAIVVRDQGKQLQVQVSGLPMSMKNTDLSMIAANPDVIAHSKSNLQNSSAGKSSRLSKSTEKALMAENTGSSSSMVQDSNMSGVRSPTIRMDFNTVDVRGCNLEEAIHNVQQKLSNSVMRGCKTIFVLHGHGSGGVLKSKLRGWLKGEKTLIKSWAPADQSDGGDAFTRIELK
jgi:DNA mismatch repair protein MutS2